jgi:hypothetical protein
MHRNTAFGALFALSALLSCSEWRIVRTKESENGDGDGLRSALGSPFGRGRSETA